MFGGAVFEAVGVQVGASHESLRGMPGFERGTAGLLFVEAEGYMNGLEVRYSRLRVREIASGLA